MGIAWLKYRVRCRFHESELARKPVGLALRGARRSINTATAKMGSSKFGGCQYVNARGRPAEISRTMDPGPP